MEFVPENAPLVVLGFLGTCALLAGMAGCFVYAWATERRALAGWLLAGAAVVSGTYGSLLLGFSLTSHEKVLVPGEWKYFCEVDCHLAYSIADVVTIKTLGAPPRQQIASGTFYLVTLKTWFDERTISSWRPKEMSLYPAVRQVAVVDEEGRVFGVSAEGQRALEAAQGGGTPLTQPLRPGESYTTTLVFDLPVDARNPRLLLSTVDPPTYLLIGHENSFFHKKTLLRLEPQPAPAALSTPR